MRQAKAELGLKNDKFSPKLVFDTEVLSRAITALEELPLGINPRSVAKIFRTVPDWLELTIRLAAPTATIDLESFIDSDFADRVPKWFLCAELEPGGIDFKTFTSRVKFGTYVIHPAL